QDSRRIEPFQQARASAPLSPLEARHSIGLVSSNPSKKGCPAHPESVGNLVDRQPPRYGIDGPHPQFKGRVPSWCMLFHVPKLKNDTVWGNGSCRKFFATGYTVDPWCQIRR